MSGGGVEAAPSALSSSWSRGEPIELPAGTRELALFCRYTPADDAGAAALRLLFSRDGSTWYYAGAADDDAWAPAAPYGRAAVVVLELALPASGESGTALASHTSLPCPGARWAMVEAAEVGAPGTPGALTVGVVRC